MLFWRRGCNASLMRDPSSATALLVARRRARRRSRTAKRRAPTIPDGDPVDGVGVWPEGIISVPVYARTPSRTTL